MRLVKRDEVDEELGENLLIQLRDDDDHLASLDGLIEDAERRLGRARDHQLMAQRAQADYFGGLLGQEAEVGRHVRALVRAANEEVSHAERAASNARSVVAEVRAHNQLERDEVCAWLHERGLSEIRPELVARIAGAHRQMRSVPVGNKKTARATTRTA